METVEGENIATMMMEARYDMQNAKVALGALPKPFVQGDVRAERRRRPCNSRACLVDFGWAGEHDPIRKEHDRHMLALWRRELLAIVGEEEEQLMIGMY
ncbi:hypothetical protein BD310DRAFT_834794 [Dichomitus squalens]|uniref:Uncharacterized protein n=1 Tax=Dichomitus squalens TaxID=114155 RepID=A0A4Q9P9E5_9APHY|nr:hypothetical protein BD310DRAFT_834794 [Dichomitus squalens]